MIVLPRGKPVKEGGRTLGMNWQDVMEKLHHGHFTGYLNFVAEDSRGLLLFFRGQLTVVRFQSRDEVLAGNDALGSIFSAAQSDCARLDIYRLDPTLAVHIYNLIEGSSRYRGQHRELIDIPYLIAQLKRDGFSGGLHVQGGGETAIILMDAGHFIGFFHDGHAALATTADLPASVAWNQGAKIDVIDSAGVCEADLPDFFKEIDLIAIWENALLDIG